MAQSCSTRTKNTHKKLGRSFPFVTPRLGRDRRIPGGFTDHRKCLTKKIKIIIIKIKKLKGGRELKWDMVTLIFSPSTQEAKVDMYVNSRPAMAKQ